MSVYLNQRKGSRNENQAMVKYSRWGGIECYDARIHDCSENGICFRSEFPYIPGTEIAVKLDKHDEESLVSVVWSRMQSDPGSGKPYFRIGARFIAPIL